jgi:hypothetical protein
MNLLRRDRQRAGRQSVVLEWVICVTCHHVRLDHWVFVDATLTDAGNSDERSRA